MSMTRDELMDAIQDFFGDTSRPAGETKDALEEIALEAQQLADTIDDDGEDEESDEEE